MKYKNRLLLAAICIVVISWLDYQAFMEANTAVSISDTARKAFHIASYFGILLAGALTWKPISLHLYRIWVVVYGLVFTAIFAIGLLDRLFHFGDNFLNEVSRLRMFFCSPMPFAALYVFYLIERKD